MGANATLNINIQSSDYPNGVFEINSNLSTMFLAEDKDDIPLDGQLVFERKYGSFFSAKVISCKKKFIMKRYFIKSYDCI